MTGLTGTGTLIRLILRRDRIVLPIWILLTALVPIGIASSFAALYPTPAALKAYADLSMGTPATIAVLGFVYSPTIGGLTAWRTGLQSTFLIVPVSILLVIRHTRADEEAGRRELLGASVVGRNAPLTAALAVVFGANLAIAALIAGGLIGLGLPAAGALALGLSAASAGWVFAAVAAVAAQLTESPGPARHCPGSLWRGIPSARDRRCRRPSEQPLMAALAVAGWLGAAHPRLCRRALVGLHPGRWPGRRAGGRGLCAIRPARPRR
jgi:ABC-2 type transport system permease protein